MSPPSSCLCISGISVCVIRIGLRSLEDGRPQRRMAPRRMSLRRMAPRRREAEKEEARDRCPRGGRCVVGVAAFEDSRSYA